MYAHTVSEDIPEGFPIPPVPSPSSEERITQPRATYQNQRNNSFIRYLLLNTIAN
jgi:hypothetical protein